MPDAHHYRLECFMEPSQASRDLSYRIGAAALGMFSGMALGALTGLLMLQIAPCIGGGALAGIVTGLAFPDLAMRGAEMTVHFFAGLLRGARGLVNDDLDGMDDEQEAGGHRWLRAAFTFGVVFSCFVALWLRL